MKKLVSVFGLACLILNPVAADDGSADAENVSSEERKSKFGYGTRRELGPTSVPSELVDADKVNEHPRFRIPVVDRIHDPYYAWKADLNKKYDLRFSIDYNILYQTFDSSPGPGTEQSGASGVARAFGEWVLLNRDDQGSHGSLVTKFEHRHRMADIAPQDLGLQAGYAGITGANFNDAQWLTSNLYWKQRFLERKGLLILGQIDRGEYVDMLPIASPYTTFQNLSSVVNPVLPFTIQALGFHASYKGDAPLYVAGGMSDANAVSGKLRTDKYNGETFKHVAVGLTETRESFFSNNAQLTFWHQDRLSDTGGPESWGIVASAIKTSADAVWAVGGRAGWADEPAGPAERHLGLAITHNDPSDDDVHGLSVAWDDIWNAAQDDQITSEAFWNIQLSPNMEITPSVQYIANPALDPTKDDLWLYSARWRVTL